MSLLRWCRAAIGLIAVLLAAGAAVVLAYQQIHWYYHAVWFDVPFGRLWQWLRLDPSLLERHLGQRIGASLTRWPLWVCLLVPAVAGGWIFARLGQWLGRRQLGRAEAMRRRDAA